MRLLGLTLTLAIGGCGGQIAPDPATSSIPSAAEADGDTIHAKILGSATLAL